MIGHQAGPTVKFVPIFAFRRRRGMLIRATLSTLAGVLTLVGTLTVARTFEAATPLISTRWFTGRTSRSSAPRVSSKRVTTSAPARSEAMMGTLVFMLME